MRRDELAYFRRRIREKRNERNELIETLSIDMDAYSNDEVPIEGSYIGELGIASIIRKLGEIQKDIDKWEDLYRYLEEKQTR